MQASTQEVIQERRSRSVQMVRKLVSVRTDMLRLFGRLITQKPYEGSPEIQDLLQEFCQTLVDYTANAHFQLYRYFAENRERRKDVFAVADKIYPRVMDITQAILEFNDKYDGEKRDLVVTHLEKDLSILGEQLAERIELEDELITILVGARR